MTGLLHEREFSRKSFVKGGGALVVGFGLAGAGLAGTAAAAESPLANSGPPDPRVVGSWLAIHADNTASLRSGRIELGQGSTTALVQIAGEELGMDMSQLRHISFDTAGPNASPNSGNTGGSTSIRQGGLMVRAAAAAAKQALLGLASTRLGVPASSLSVNKGVVSGGGKSVTYGELIGDKLFNVTAPSSYKLAARANGLSGPGLAEGAPGTKPVSEYTLVGTSVPRLDIPDVVTAAFVYAVNVRVPGMLHGRVVRPRGQGAYGDGTAPQILSVDESSIKNIPDVQIVRKGNFLGVVAPKEYDAIQAAAELKVKWADPPAISGVGNIWGAMRQQDSAGQAPASFYVNDGDATKALASAAQTVSQTYTFDYQGHMPIGPNIALADVGADNAVIFTHIKNGYGVMRPKVASVLGMNPKQVRVIYYRGSSSFGGGAIHADTGQAAAIMSQAVGKPVRLQLMRWDEHGWDNYGPAQMMDVQGGLDGNGKLVAYEYTQFAIPYYGTTPSEQLIGKPIVPPSFGGLGLVDRSNSGSQYTIPNRRVTGKALPALNNYFKSNTLRAPNAPAAVFASEQLIDELAHAAGMDPVEFRRLNIATTNDPGYGSPGGGRWSDQLEAVTKLANWQPHVAASTLSAANVVHGRGIALGGFAGSMSGAVADIQVNKKTGKITVNDLYSTLDAGLIVNPGLIENQMVGSLIQGTSRAMVEQVKFNRQRVTSLDWVGYPILRFKDHPNVHYQIVQRLDLQSTGGGEPATTPVAAAIANAFFDATGVRIRQAPMTPGRVRATLKAAGAA